MRILAGLAMIALGSAAASGACAQSLGAQTLTGSAEARALADAAFAPGARRDEDFSGLIDHQDFAADGRPIAWSSSEVQLSGRADGPVDSLRLTTGAALTAPGGLPLNLDRAQAGEQDYELAVIRNWPRALAFEGGRFDIGLSPHAGVGVGSRGGSAEAGAELRLEARDEVAADGLEALGVGDGARFGDQGRWYLFAAASGRAVGLNMLRGEGGWDRAGWTTDPTSALIGDAHVGVGFRKGALQTSFGLIHREVKGQHMVFGQETKDDTIAAFSLTIRPRVLR